MRELAVAPATAFLGHGQQRADLAEITALKKEVAKFKAERDILNKGCSVLREGVDVKFAFIAKNRHI